MFQIIYKQNFNTSLEHIISDINKWSKNNLIAYDIVNLITINLIKIRFNG